MNMVDVATYADSLTQEEKNQLIQLVVGEQPVMMNVDITLAHGVHRINGTILMNENTKFRGFDQH